MPAPAKRLPYPSDLTDEQWRQIAPLIPPQRPRGRHRSTDLRAVADAIAYRTATGCVWRMLPHDFPPWATVYTYFRQWDRDGTLPAIRAAAVAPRPEHPAPPDERPAGELVAAAG